MRAGLAGFEALTPIYEGARSIVYRAREAERERPVILKVLKDEFPSADALIRYRQEYEVMTRLDFPGAIRALELRPLRSTLVIVLEDFGADSLANIALARRLSLVEVLSIGARLADQLGEIHARGIIHKDICPANIVWNPRDDVVKVIDYGISSTFSRESPRFESCHAVAGTFAYIAPEQTGRMNRSLDHRADLYAAGATLYELLSGRPPFAAKDALEMVHCHIARVPRPLRELDPSIPEPVSRIVAKLLQKTAEERYQSARGLGRDLARCREALERGGAIAPFALGADDASEALTLSQRLYGRDAEVATLLAAFERAAGGSREVVLVTGAAGAGKTSAVHEVHRPITRQRGFFVSGKFDPLQRDVPHAPIVSALRTLIQQLLTEDDASLSAWKQRLLSAVGQQGRLITSVLPELERVIGPQPTLADVGAAEAAARFSHVFRAFVRALCAAEHPLVLFLDDLQWADASSLRLIEVLLTDDALSHLLVIGAYRDNEVSPVHPAQLTIDALARGGVRIERAHLPPLSQAHVAALLSDSLRCPRDDVVVLAAVVMRKTAGNPYFVLQFIEALARQRLLSFDARRGGWTWDARQIEAQAFTDNVVELVIDRLRALSEPTQRALSMASLLGGRFELGQLSIVLGHDDAATFEALRPALHDGIVRPASAFRAARAGGPTAPLVIDELRFAHDRVQQAAAALIPERARAAAHLRIGRLLRAELGAERRGRRLFEVVAHLNAARALITDGRERDALLRLNAEAGAAAMCAQAAETAAELFAAAMEDGGARLRALDPELAFASSLKRANAEALLGRLDVAERLVLEALSTVDAVFEGDRVRKADAYVLLIRLRTLAARYSDARAAATDALRLFDIALPTEREACAVAPLLARIERLLEERPLASLASLDETHELDVRATMALLNEMCPPSFFLDANLFLVIGLHLARVTLERGLTRWAGSGFAMFSQVLRILGRLADAATVGRAAMDIADRFGDPAQGAQARNIYGANTGVWVEHVRDMTPVLERGCQEGLAGGVPQLSGFMINNLMMMQLFEGVPLARLLEKAPDHLRFAEKSATRITVHVIEAVTLVASNLAGRTDGPLAFHLGGRSEDDFLRVWEAHQSHYAICSFLIDRGLARLLHGDPRGAFDDLARAEPLLPFIAGNLATAKHALLFALAHAVTDGDAPAADRRARREKMAALHAQLAAWADLCPANFRHMSLFIGGEIARLEGDWATAVTRLGEAAEDARAQGFVHHEAMAHERAAALWLSLDRPEYAQPHLLGARQGFELWGAAFKVAELNRRFPELGARAQRRSTLLTTQSEEVATSTLDVLSVVKATQAVSGEIALDRLLSTLLGVVLESAGAERGALLLAEEGGLFVEAEVRAGGEPVRVEQHTPIEVWPSGPRSIATYVARTGEAVVLGDAQADHRFGGDAHVRASGARSLLCLPILKQGRLLAILFLANDVALDAFTTERVALLRILAGQAAVSLENAQLLRREHKARAAAEHAVRLRDEFLIVASHELRTPMTSLTMSVQSMMRAAKKAPLPAAFARSIELTQRQSARLTRLIDELLDVSRVQGGVLELDRDEVDLRALAADVIRRMELDLSRANCALSLDADTSVVGFWDRSRLDQVLTNLLSNALKFGPDRPIEVRIAARDARAQIEVQDHGIGLDDAERARVFDRFHRGVSAKHYGGLGLGLFVAKGIVEAHGGTIGVASKKGEGATFVIDLPCRAGPSKATEGGDRSGA